MTEKLLAEVRSKDPRLLSRIITAVENDDSSFQSELHSLYPYTQNAIRIGITGPPGAGKSTIIDKLITEIRKSGKSLGVITVDPTSPFSGGALLGDRVRMNQHTLDPDVFIRSMGSRGERGGLARKSRQVADLLSAGGKEIIILETIGVGQADVEIVQSVDITVVVLVPESGDEIQFMKAGPLDIGDLFVINKADREGAQTVAHLLHDYLESGDYEREFMPKILMTVATEGKGVEELYSGCFELLEKLRSSGALEKRRQMRYLEQVRALVKETLVDTFWTAERKELLDRQLMEFRDQRLSPYDVASILLQTAFDKM